MDDFPEKLRRHYLAQSLPADAVARIRQKGEQARRQRRQRVGWLSLVAAALMITFGLYSYLRYNSRVEFAEVETAVETFFSQPDYQLDHLSPDPEILRTWLVQQGAPTQARVPQALGKLPSVGCEVLPIGRRRVFIICFDAPLETLSAPALPAMTKPAAASPMMKKGKPGLLVHLIVIPTSSLRHPPVDGVTPLLEERRQWAYLKWTDAGVTYLVASMVDPEQLRKLLHT